MNSTIKQADVVLLGFPLGFNMSATVRRNDLLFYGELGLGLVHVSLKM